MSLTLATSLDGVSTIADSLAVANRCGPDEVQRNLVIIHRNRPLPDQPPHWSEPNRAEQNDEWTRRVGQRAHASPMLHREGGTSLAVPIRRRRVSDAPDIDVATHHMRRARCASSARPLLLKLR